jgi:hypothetical protein
VELELELEELQREQGRRVAVCPLPAYKLAQAREDQLAGDVAELEQELRAAKEVKEDAMQCVLAARQGKEAAEERAGEERARLQVMGLLYSCCIDYPQAFLDLGTSGGLNLCRCTRKNRVKQRCSLITKSPYKTRNMFFLYCSTNHISEPERETILSSSLSAIIKPI